MPDLDPSRVYGYVALVDPDTEQPHLLVNYDTVPPTASIALYWLTFHFVNPTIPTQTADVRIDGGFFAAGCAWHRKSGSSGPGCSSSASGSRPARA